MIKLLTAITFSVLTFVTAEEKISFNQHIRPILSDKCFYCHGPDEKHIKGKLQLHTFEKATALLGKKKNKQAVKPGNPEGSLLWQRITTDDEDDIMPPPETHKTLSNQEKNLLKQWIQQGAEYENHWSFEPIKSVVPPVDKSGWSVNGIDTFILEKLKKNNLKPTSQADKRTLIRRLALDLKGLPPTRNEIEKFLTDNSPDSYEKVVDEFLNSPQYGEHMARYWLDVVRYGDTHGLHADNYREMYFYRDWVIKSFNENKPFDQFTIEQVAGDMLENPTDEQLIASGFNRLHISNSAGSALEEELYVNNVKDRVNAVGTVFLGLTLGCASCHDHKYDPLTQKEYYQLFAYFNNLDGPSHNMGVKTPPPFLQFPTDEQKKKMAELKDLIGKESDKGKKKKFQSELKKLNQSIPATLIMKERAEARQAFILNRGEYDQPGDKVSRQTPAFLPAMDAGLSMDRLGLAKWLVSEQHPLTSRVTVNRIWQQFFGVGIVKTSEDFGSQGQWPSHPQLLDYLSHQFIKSGWDVKKLVKSIVMSSTYRQSSRAKNEMYIRDPENRLMARGPRFRMDAEMLRDQALFISGLLSQKMYGKSVKPPQPDGLWKSVALLASNTKKYKADTGDDIYRRSIYTFWKRALPPPTMTTFNAPTRENCTARRERTNTPLQALVLMNEEQFFEASMKLAELTVKQSSSTIERINFLYGKLTGNLPDKYEISLISLSLNEFQKFYKDKKSIQLHGKIVSSEIAVWTMAANSLMGLDKFKCKE